MIIAFTGGYGVGKSTAISITRTLLGDLRLVKFAQPLYDMQEYAYKRISSVYKRPKEFVKDRTLLQWLGTNWGREVVGKNVWVDIWKAEASVNLAVGNIVVCDDCRFDNEAETIKSMGGIIIKLVRPDNAKHASEAGIDQKYIDFVVENDNTVEALRDKLVACYRAINL
jgi:hypothetical protein